MSTATTSDTKLVDQFEGFLRKYYHSELSQLAAEPNRTSIEIDWMTLFQYNPDLADDLLEHPGRTLDALEEAILEHDTPVDSLSNVTPRIVGVTEEELFSVGEYRAENIADYIGITGQVNQVTDVKPTPVEAVFMCERCGHETIVPQGSEFQEPYQCESCERQGPFSLLKDKTTWDDQQLVKLTQPPEEVAAGSSGSTIEVVLNGDIVGELLPGDRVDMFGTLDADDSGDSDSSFPFSMEGRAFETEQTDYEEVDIDEHLEEVQAIANGEYGEPLDLFVDSLAPKIIGLEEEKLAVILQMFGGNRVEGTDGSGIRGDSHILLLGDPGVGKSRILRHAKQIAPRSTFASGENSSGVGLTASVVPDDFGDGKWSLEAGALVMADKGLACIDEIDKAKQEDLEKLHSPLEAPQKITVNKANFSDVELNARAALLAAGNPKYGRFDKYEPISKQIDLTSTLMSRFDLMFMLSDQPDPEKDSEIAHASIRNRQLAIKKDSHPNELSEEEKEEIEPAVDPDIFRAYIAYAKQNLNPVMPEEHWDYLVDQYTEIRMANGKEDDHPVPVTARKIDAFQRLAEASALAHHRETVNRDDIERAVSLVRRSLNDVGIDPETGEFDADIVETGSSKAQRDRKHTVLGIVDELAGVEEGAEDQAVVDTAVEEGFDSDNIWDEIESLKKNGELYDRGDGLRTTDELYDKY